MKKLLNSIKENYGIQTHNIEKLGVTTINDIFLIKSNGENYIAKIFNVDEEPQIRNSLLSQKNIHDSLGAAPDVILNKDKKLYTEYENKYYAIQEYIEEQSNSKIDLIEETSKQLFLLHQKLKELDETKYENKKETKNYLLIKDNIEKTRKILRKVDIKEESNQYFKKLLDKREYLLKKYKCEYNPTNFQVIHRDMRLSNIIVSEEKIYFIDFDYIAYGDLLFEIGSSAMLISDFELEKAKDFIETYNFYAENKYTNEEIFKNLLGYYVQSDFPIKLINKVKEKAIIEFIKNRLKCLEFCEKFLYK